MSYRRYRRPGINPIWVIIGVNIVIFFAYSFDRTGVIETRLGLTPALVGQQPWTLFTYMFLHAPFPNVGHIIFNMLTFYFFGTFTIALIGETAFLTTYFVGGIVGGLFYFLLSFPLGMQGITVVGASGAVYALGGLLMVMRPRTRVYTFPIPVPMPLWIAILVGFILVTIFFFNEIAWQAHLGGIVYGAAIGYYYRRREMRR